MILTPRPTTTTAASTLQRTKLLAKHLTGLSSSSSYSSSFSTSTVKMAEQQKLKGKLDVMSKITMKSGWEIPRLGYGVYQTPASECPSLVSHALSLNYRHIDSAVGYKNEAGCALGLLNPTTPIPRSQLFFTTKIPPGKNTYPEAKALINQTLQITNLSYIDLYLIHAPYGGKEGRLGAWKALVEGVEEGKIRSIGVSNYGVHHLEELEEWIKSVEEEKGMGKGGTVSVNQVELHPWLNRGELCQWCEERGILLEAYSPIVRNTKASDPLLAPLAKKHNKTPNQILLRWSLQKGFIPLPKSVTPSRIAENAQIYDFELDEEDMKNLDLKGVYEPCAWDPTVSKD